MVVSDRSCRLLRIEDLPENIPAAQGLYSCDQQGIASHRTWVSRGIQCWSNALHHFELDAASDIIAHQRTLVSAVMALQDPLRWHTVRAARSMVPQLQFPRLQRAEISPSTLPPSSNRQLVCGRALLTSAATAACEQDVRQMLRFHVEQLGIATFVTPLSA